MNRQFQLTLVGRLGGALTAAVAVLIALAPSVAAESNPPCADLSFRKAVPLAAQVVIGTVTEVQADGLSPYNASGPSARFTLVVEQALRGKAPPIMHVEYLETHGCYRFVSASVGDRVALALQVAAADPPIATNTAAWIHGSPPGPGAFESITMAETVALVGQGPPDTSTEPREHSEPAQEVAPFGLIFLASAALILWRGKRSLGGASYPEG